jgi:hypothetical protein
MQDKYTFQGGSDKQFQSRNIPLDVLPEDDYDFRILTAQEPYYKADTERWVMKCLLSIGTKGHEVSYSPSTAVSGKDRDGVKRDAIGDLFIAVNRAPRKGEEIEVGRLIGAGGRCRLKKEIWNNEERNAVARIYIPKQVGPTSEQPPRQSYSPEEVAQASKSAQAAAGGGDIAPDDIPF